jgi:hypothetical protein
LSFIAASALDSLAPKKKAAVAYAAAA